MTLGTSLSKTLSTFAAASHDCELLWYEFEGEFEDGG